MSVHPAPCCLFSGLWNCWKKLLDIPNISLPGLPQSPVELLLGSFRAFATAWDCAESCWLSTLGSLDCSEFHHRYYHTMTYFNIQVYTQKQNHTNNEENFQLGLNHEQGSTETSSKIASIAVFSSWLDFLATLSQSHWLSLSVLIWAAPIRIHWSILSKKVSSIIFV